MKQDTIASHKSPLENHDPLTILLREGAHTLIHQAVEAALGE